MPKCGNCGSHVTEDYVRVMTPEDVDQPRTCPQCDLVRVSGNEVRERAYLASGHEEVASGDAAPDWSEARNERRDRVVADGGDDA